MKFRFIHKGYYRAVSDLTDESYVVRTRPKNDGWMAIDESDGLVMATGKSLFEAKKICREVDKAKVIY